jgi:peptide-methionine (S)-S-oxide reductase
VRLTAFPGATFLLDPAVWNAYDWSVQHGVLRSSDEPTRL